jgi:sec-independent protein translocase protein TatA
MPNIGPLELVLILLVVLLLFGAKRLPELGRSLGSGMKEFKDSVTGKDDRDDAAGRAQLESADAPVAARAGTQTETPAETTVEAEPRT